MDLLEFTETVRDTEREKTYKVILACTVIIILTILAYAYL